jgi:AraC-like DNA-binding protein
MLRPERERECLWIIFMPQAPLPQLERRRYTLVQDRDDAIARAARAMARAQQAGTAAGELIARGHLQVILGLVLASASSAPGDDRGPWQVPAAGPLPAGLLAQVDRLIERALADPPSRAEVAAALRMSESSFSHRFRAETGLTLSERVRWLRVRAAKTRLGDPDASVKRVAGELGFSSPFYFSRVFTEVTGMTPSAYRSALRGGQAPE